MASIYLKPQWQRRRLEILSRAGFTCEHCGEKNDTLHVHHRVYRRGRKPWEYSDSELICLCAKCHALVEGVKEELAEAMVSLTIQGLEDMVLYARAVAGGYGPRIITPPGRNMLDPEPF